MTRRERDILFVSEASMCDALRDATRAAGWTFYPEQSGWDALLVRPDESQIGVQAKLKPNVEVLRQLVQHRDCITGPDIIATLTPEVPDDFGRVVRALGGVALRGACLIVDDSRWSPPDYLDSVFGNIHVPRTAHTVRCPLPPFVPNMPAGVPAPHTVSEWKIGMARLCAALRAGETFTSREMLERFGILLSRIRLWVGEVDEGRRPPRWKYEPRIEPWRPLGFVPLPDAEWPYIAEGLGLPDPRLDPHAPKKPEVAA